MGSPARLEYSAVFLAGTGFPEAKTAYNHKLTMMGKSLLLTKYKPIVTSKHPSSVYRGPKKGISEGIEYLYFCPAVRSKSLLDKAVNYLRASYRELRFLVRLAHRSRQLVMIISIGSPLQILYYSILRKVLRARLIASIMEYHVAEARGLPAKFKAVFFDHYSYLFCDGIIPISRMLANLTMRRNPDKPVLIVPVLADYRYVSQARLPSVLTDRVYFLICAGIGYTETIEFCIKSFKQMNNQSCSLVMILSGNKEEVDLFQANKAKHDRIFVFSALAYEDLFSLYSGARALLIPLRENQRDEARFPQKIAEYLSSGRPIITNSYGEINHYFVDGKDAVVLGEYNSQMFAEAMDKLADNQDLADSIGHSGRTLGLKTFDYRTIATPLEAFFDNLWRS